MARKICITGGVACGKSSAGNVLRQMGLPVIDADDVCHELLRRDRTLARRLVSLFGGRILDQQGAIDRRALARIIFADERQRRRLNALLHPAARRRIKAWLKRQSAPGPAVVVVPLAYEAGWDRDWDKIVCVAAPLAMRLARLKKKGLAEKEARARIRAQWPLAEKMNRADYVIFNSGTLPALRRQTELLFRKNLSRAGVTAAQAREVPWKKEMEEKT